MVWETKRVHGDRLPFLGIKTWSKFVRVDAPDKGRVNSSQLGMDISEGPVGEGTLVRNVVGIKGLVCRTSNTENGSILEVVPVRCKPVRVGDHG